MHMMTTYPTLYEQHFVFLGDRNMLEAVELTLILPRSRMGTVWFYTSTSNKRAARPKLFTKPLARDFKAYV